MLVLERDVIHYDVLFGVHLVDLSQRQSLIRTSIAHNMLLVENWEIHQK